SQSSLRSGLRSSSCHPGYQSVSSSIARSCATFYSFSIGTNPFHGSYLLSVALWVGSFPRTVFHRSKFASLISAAKALGVGMFSVLCRLSTKIGISLALLLLCSTLALGQSTYGSITGSVTDPSGAAIAGASVTLTNVGTSETRTQPTNADGQYSFVNLIPRQHKIDVEKQVFKHSSIPSLAVQGNQS